MHPGWMLRPLAGGAAVLSAAALAACGSDSDVDKAAVEKSVDKELKQVLGGDTGKVPKDKFDKLVSCTATVLIDNGDPEDVQALADGKKKVDDVKPKKGKSKKDMEKAGEKCGDGVS